MQRIYLLVYLVIMLIGRLFMLALRLVSIPLILIILLVQKMRGQLPSYTALELDILKKAEDTVSQYRTALIKLDRDYYVAAESILRARATYLRNGGSKLPYPLGQEILFNIHAGMFRDPLSIEKYFRLEELLDEVILPEQ